MTKGKFYTDVKLQKMLENYEFFEAFIILAPESTEENTEIEPKNTDVSNYSPEKTGRNFKILGHNVQISEIICAISTIGSMEFRAAI
jgi:hypothetical protein